jgi:putative transposase
VSTKKYKKYPYLPKGLKITYVQFHKTYHHIPMAKGLHLTDIDLHTRFVLNWSVGNTMSADWCAGYFARNHTKHGVPGD